MPVTKASKEYVMLKKYNIKNYNFILLALVIVTSVYGLVIINSADPTYTFRQAGGIVAASIWMVFLSFIDYNKILKHYRLWYIISVALLAAVLVLGHSAGGAQRWISLGPVNLQPSEISKVLLVMFLAKFLSMNKSRLNTWRFLIFMTVLILIPLGLLVAEPDLSQTILMFLILFIVLFCGDLPYNKIGKVLAVAVPIVIILLIYIQNPNQKLLKPYQWMRVMAFFDPENYDDNIYQQRNAVRAIGSGGLSGKGLNNEDPTSLLNSDSIPEAHTDFVFAALGEQLGFAGCIVAIALLAAIVFVCIRIAMKTRSYEGRLVAVGIAAHVGMQTVFNIGVVTQLLPNTGLALPFFSYGISSLIALYTAMGIVLNISLQKEPYRERDLYTKDFVDVREYRNGKRQEGVRVRRR